MVTLLHLDAGLLHKPDNITLNPASKRIHQSVSVFQTGTGAAADAILNTEQLISHTRIAMVYAIASL